MDFAGLPPITVPNASGDQVHRFNETAATIGTQLEVLGESILNGDVYCGQSVIAGNGAVHTNFIRNVAAAPGSDPAVTLDASVVTVTGFLEGQGGAQIAGNVAAASMHSIGEISTDALVRTDELRGLVAEAVTIRDNVVITGDLTVQGSSNTANPYWVAGRVRAADQAVLNSKGRYSFTVSRAPGYSTGVFLVEWSEPHPDGANLVAVLSGEAGSTGSGWQTIGNMFNSSDSSQRNNANRLWVLTRSNTGGLTDGDFQFIVLA